MEHIAPLAKILAEANGIDWQQLRGSGAGGMVVEQDILNYLSRVMSGEEEPPATPVDDMPEGWTGHEELPAGMFSAAQLSQAGIDSDIADFVTRSRAPQTSAAQPVSSMNHADFELDDELGDLNAPLAAEPQYVPPPVTAPRPSAANNWGWDAPQEETQAQSRSMAPAHLAPDFAAFQPTPREIGVSTESAQSRGSSQTQIPDLSAPELPAPAVHTPELRVPDLSAPSIPGVATPEIDAPEFDLPSATPPVPAEVQMRGGMAAGLSGLLSRLYHREKAPEPEPVQPVQVQEPEVSAPEFEAPVYPAPVYPGPALEVSAPEMQMPPVDLTPAPPAAAPLGRHTPAFLPNHDEVSLADQPGPEVAGQMAQPHADELNAPEFEIPAPTPGVSAAPLTAATSERVIAEDDGGFELTAPEVVVSDPGFPEMEAPKWEASAAHVPELAVPEVIAPDLTAFELEAPEVDDFVLPEIDAVLGATPESQPPATPLPEALPVAASAHPEPSTDAVWFGTYLRRDAQMAAADDLRVQLSEALGKDVSLAFLVARAAQRHADVLGLDLGTVALRNATGQEQPITDGAVRDAVNARYGDQDSEVDLLVTDAGALGVDDLHYPHTLTLSLGRVQEGRAALSLNGDVDPQQAAKFLTCVAEALEKPIALVL
ncbi:E3 binding domain-containing protein [Deinococcus arenicola]|uniref:E3 binding domain-containing protein n=1 Tax=Deinococcus arenicola TaxID=2994950 RepID=A0ABU4DT77_9DEIO|nr:E3 binding domain-containing protein [Deinococcus sp. ZS9-10]MDV6375632.1 E3 binding domain-containing protein [Deinococcus sp. ZS9-10]